MYVPSETNRHEYTLQIKQILEQEKNIIAGFPVISLIMLNSSHMHCHLVLAGCTTADDMKSLEEEYKAMQGDKSGEVEYFQTLDETINGMKVLWCCSVWMPHHD